MPDTALLWLYYTHHYMSRKSEVLVIEQILHPQPKSCSQGATVFTAWILEGKRSEVQNCIDELCTSEDPSVQCESTECM